MTYILMIYTIVAAASGTAYQDWRPIGEFQSSAFLNEGPLVNGLTRCETAAQQLGLKAEKYRCVRTK